MQKIDYATTLRALNEAVAMRGHGYKDKDAMSGATCRNVLQREDGTWTPSCIVGTALVWLGVPVEWFAENECFSSSAYIVTSKLRESRLFSFEADAADLLVEAQVRQDNQATWGDAVVFAHLGQDAFAALPPRD